MYNMFFVKRYVLRCHHGPEGNLHLAPGEGKHGIPWHVASFEQWKKPEVWGRFILPSYVGMIENHYKDTYYTTCILESKPRFFSWLISPLLFGLCLRPMEVHTPCIVENKIGEIKVCGWFNMVIVDNLKNLSTSRSNLTSQSGGTLYVAKGAVTLM